MTFQNLASTKEFQALHPVKKQIIEEIMRSGANSSPEIMLPKIMSINNELSKRGLKFTKEETNLLIKIMKDDMPPEQQQKVDMLTGLFFK